MQGTLRTKPKLLGLQLVPLINKDNVFAAAKDIASGNGLKSIVQAALTGGLAGNNIPRGMIVSVGLQGVSFKNNLVKGSIELAANYLGRPFARSSGARLF